MLAGVDRTVAHLDLDAFFVSVERLRNPALAGKPVLIGGLSERGVVASCSYETRRYGVHAAMPVKLARQLCPEAIVIRGDMEAYSRYSEVVTQIIADKAPLYEKASIDEHYLDLTGMDKFFGSWQWTRELRQTIVRETGLPLSLGLSTNKTVSKIATGQVKPNGEKRVPLLEVKEFLNPLSIRKIPGLGEKSYLLLRSMGVERIETLAAMPVELVEKVLGVQGRAVWEKANGIDLTPVVPYSERKSIGTEHTFETDTIEVIRLQETLLAMVEEVAYQLRQQRKVAGCVTVKIRYANFDTHTQQARIPYTSADHLLLAKAKDLFGKLFQRRMRVRLVGVRLSHLVSGYQQISLFEDTKGLTNLYQAMDHLHQKYNRKLVGRAAGMDYWKQNGRGNSPPF